MTGRYLLPAIKIVGISVPVTWAWLEWGRDAYGHFFTQIAIPVFGFLGYTNLLPEGARDRFINYLPFLILMIVTPRMSWLRRWGGIAVGFIVIFVFHLIFVFVFDLAFPRPNQMTEEGYPTFLPAMLVSDSIPFVLWIVIAQDFVKEKAAQWLGGGPLDSMDADSEY